MRVEGLEPGRFYDLWADLYDADYEALGWRDDLALYRELARAAGGPVLEMGCGSGRVLLELARSGVEVSGLDLSPEMLAVLGRRLAAEPPEVRERVKRLVVGDARDAEPAERFALVIAPFRVVQHFVERADQRAWLANVTRHLAPGGELVFDVFQTNYRYLAEASFTVTDVERTDAGGRPVRRTVHVEHRPEAQTFSMRMEWVLGEGAAAETRAAETTVRWFTRAELENLLELAGFRVLEVWGDFDRSPHGAGSPQIVVRARPTRG